MKEMLETLLSAYEYIPKLYEGIQTVISQYRESKIIEANEMIVAITEGLQWLTEAIDLTRDAQKEAINIFEINDSIAEIIEALENEDTVLLADLLEYELLEKLEVWYDKIGASLEGMNFQDAE